MTDRNLYFIIENLALTNGQRATLFADMQALGVFNDGLPNQRNHWRIRLDNDAAIHHATFDDDSLGITPIKNFLANVFGVDASTIDHSSINVTFADRPTRVVTFSRLGVDYVRMAIMGYTPGNWPTFEESRIETVQYLIDNAVDWETEL